MTSHRTKIIPVTPEMYEEFVGEPAKVTLRAVAAVKEGRIIGMAGVYVDRKFNRLAMFSHLTDEIRKDRRTIARGIRILMGIAARMRLDVHAVADETVPGSEKLLQHMGFVKNTVGVYVWHS